MSELRRSDEESGYGVDLHPRHDAWAQISTRGTLIGFGVFLALAALLVLWIQIR
jgi:hypothetical protein